MHSSLRRGQRFPHRRDTYRPIEVRERTLAPCPPPRARKPDKAGLKTIIGDTSAFVNAVVDTRNYMAHRTTKLRAKASSGAALYQLNERLKLVIKACFLRELGATVEDRARILPRHVSFDVIVRSPGKTTKKKARPGKTQKAEPCDAVATSQQGTSERGV